jgi:hypothetical protein
MSNKKAKPEKHKSIDGGVDALVTKLEGASRRDELSGAVDQEGESAALTPRREKFAQELAKGASQAEAARRAGYSPRRARQTGADLVADRGVEERVRKLVAFGVEDVAAIRAGHIARLEALSRKAQELGQVAAAIRAEELIGRLHRLYTESLEIRNVGAELQALSADELEGLARNVMQRLAIHLSASEPA